MTIDHKKAFEKFEDQGVFVKTTKVPVIDGPQKAALNRKGNILFNSGDVEGARRIFLTTSYSDGLARVGDYYKAQGRPLDALKMYWIAPDRTKAEPLVMQLSLLMKKLIQGEGDLSDE